MTRIPKNYRKLKKTKEEIKNVTSYRSTKDKRDPLNAGYALRDENKYRKAVKFDGGSP